MFTSLYCCTESEIPTVRQHFECLRDFAELGFCVKLLGRREVLRMPFERQLPVATRTGQWLNAVYSDIAVYMQFDTYEIRLNDVFYSTFDYTLSTNFIATFSDIFFIIQNLTILLASFCSKQIRRQIVSLDNQVFTSHISQKWHIQQNTLEMTMTH